MGGREGGCGRGRRGGPKLARGRSDIHELHITEDKRIRSPQKENGQQADVI